MDRNEATALIEHAMQTLVDAHPELLDLDASERALTHHLAIYLQEGVPPDLHVDVEYNRHGHDPKRLHLNGKQVRVFPDVIIHRRNTDEFNIVALEVKKPNEDLEFDNQKLHALRAQLGYRHVGHVIIGRNKKGIVERGLIWV